ncbi:MAG: DUF5710 domain-containing protein [Defluviitaleaceae bacterium]|nr:DUF5710 domain-containing protein [Defluviitaleaceae bacterium]
MTAKIYLNVPYAEKDSAKSIGACWDAKIKKWYFEGPIEAFSKFGKWIAEGREQTLIIFENFCIIEALRMCFRCNKKTRVIGFGVWDHSWLIDEDNGTYSIKDFEDYPEMEDDIHLAWTEDENNVPPLLLSYLKSKYNVKTGHSNVAGKCFANHCDHCGVIQGNNYLFSEMGSPLSTETPVEEELIERMKQLKIYNVYTDTALPLNWDITYCSNDWAYVAYGNKPFEHLILPGTEDMFTSYSEMFKI